MSDESMPKPSVVEATVAGGRDRVWDAMTQPDDDAFDAAREGWQSGVHPPR